MRKTTGWYWVWFAGKDEPQVVFWDAGWCLQESFPFPPDNADVEFWFGPLIPPSKAEAHG